MNNRISRRLTEVRNHIIVVSFKSGEHADDIAKVLMMSTERVYQILKEDRERKIIAG